MEATTESKNRGDAADVADQLGLSRTTISNAYSRPDQLKPELRVKILTTAKDLGYSGPSAAARSLRSGRSGSVGLLVNDTLSYTITDPAAVQMIQGFAQVLDERGLSLLTLPAPIDLEAGVEAARAASIDSCLVFCAGPDDRRLWTILERNIPVVTVDSPRIPAAAYVGIDDRGGAKSIAEYVIRLGHRRIGVITLPLKHDGRDGFVDEKRMQMVGEHLTVARLKGYRDADRGRSQLARGVGLRVQHECERCRSAGRGGFTRSGGSPDRDPVAERSARARCIPRRRTTWVADTARSLDHRIR